MNAHYWLVHVPLLMLFCAYAWSLMRRLRWWQIFLFAFLLECAQATYK